MKIYAKFFSAVLLVMSGHAMSDNTKTKIIHTPSGPVTTKVQTVDPTPQKIVLASHSDIQAINANASKASKFVATYLPGVSSPTLKDLDEAFLRWQREKVRRYSEQQVTEILGAYLGSRLIIDLQMEWVIVTDQYGTDYAVRAKKYEVMSFPFSSVAKRIEKNQHGFMVALYETVRQTIASGDYKQR